MMRTYVALLRVVNVGGRGKLSMAELRAVCEAAGFKHVRTCVASGNVVLESTSSALQVKRSLQSALQEYAGKAVGVHVRTAQEMQAVLAANPFPDAAPNRVVALFLDQAPPANALGGMSGQRHEQVALGKREIYVHYGEGMADSRLRIPAARTGTARNMNTIAKLVEMSNQLAI